MKLIFTFFTILISCTSSIAQIEVPKMELKAAGFVGPDSISNYVVINVPKVNKADLYKRVLTYVNGLYVNPKEVVTAVENESIVVNGRTEAIRGSIDWYRYPMNYNITIEFRDGRIKFTPKVVNMKEVWSENRLPRDYYIASTDSPNPNEINVIWMLSSNTGKYFIFQTELQKSCNDWVNSYIGAILSRLNDTW